MVFIQQAGKEILVSNWAYSIVREYKIDGQEFVSEMYDFADWDVSFSIISYTVEEIFNSKPEERRVMEEAKSVS